MAGWHKPKLKRRTPEEKAARKAERAQKEAGKQARLAQAMADRHEAERSGLQPPAGAGL